MLIEYRNRSNFFNIVCWSDVKSCPRHTSMQMNSKHSFPQTPAVIYSLHSKRNMDPCVSATSPNRLPIASQQADPPERTGNTACSSPKSVEPNQTLGCDFNILSCSHLRRDRSMTGRIIYSAKQAKRKTHKTSERTETTRLCYRPIVSHGLT